MSIMKKEITFNVRERDVNLNDNIRPASVLDYFQDIAGIHADELGVGFEPMIKLNLYWVILYITFERVGKVPSFGEKINVVTWPKVKTRLESEREYECSVSRCGKVCRQYQKQQPLFRLIYQYAQNNYTPNFQNGI